MYGRTDKNGKVWIRTEKDGKDGKEAAQKYETYISSQTDCQAKRGL